MNTVSRGAWTRIGIELLVWSGRRELITSVLGDERLWREVGAGRQWIMLAIGRRGRGSVEKVAPIVEIKRVYAALSSAVRLIVRRRRSPVKTFKAEASIVSRIRRRRADAPLVISSTTRRPVMLLSAAPAVPDGGVVTVASFGGRALWQSQARRRRACEIEHSWGTV